MEAAENNAASAVVTVAPGMVGGGPIAAVRPIGMAGSKIVEVRAVSRSSNAERIVTRSRRCRGYGDRQAGGKQEQQEAG